MNMSSDGNMSVILVVNAGSSSLKLNLLPSNEAVLVERIGSAEATVKASFALEPQANLNINNHGEAFNYALKLWQQAGLDLTKISAVGHRVVHGGEIYQTAVAINDEVLANINSLSPLAPLHNPANVLGIEAARAILPNVPHIAVFDTAFHSTLPPVAYRYGIAPEFYQNQGIRRYGFHGPSHQYVTMQAAKFLNVNPKTQKIISLHLGNGASAAAVKNGDSIDTTMGFTPLAGLLMGTRAGDIDPSILLTLLRQGMTRAELDNLLNKRSGLLGMSGISNDMRDIEAAIAEGNEAAQLAFDVFCYRVKKTIGSYIAVMNGVDTIVFTAGIGEHDALVRQHCTSDLACFGIVLDETKNTAYAGGEADISGEKSSVKILIIPTNEAEMIASQARQFL